MLETIERWNMKICSEADLVLVAPMDADNLAKMLHGMVDNPLLKMLRSWDVSKRVLLIPGMSTHMWENPMTRKQLSKLRRKWNWVRALPPYLWNFNHPERKIEVQPWDGMEELMGRIDHIAALKTMGNDIEVDAGLLTELVKTGKRPKKVLPPELWTIILDYTKDWELAMALNVYTNLPTPYEWKRHESKDPDSQTFMHELEWTILTGDTNDVKKLMEDHPAPGWLSHLCIKTILRFAKTDLLSYLETTHKDLFWQSFGGPFLPDKASGTFLKVSLV